MLRDGYPTSSHHSHASDRKKGMSHGKQTAEPAELVHLEDLLQVPVPRLLLVLTELGLCRTTVSSSRGGRHITTLDHIGVLEIRKGKTSAIATSSLPELGGGSG